MFSVLLVLEDARYVSFQADPMSMKSLIESLQTWVDHQLVHPISPSRVVRAFVNQGTVGTAEFRVNANGKVEFATFV